MFYSQKKDYYLLLHHTLRSFCILQPHILRKLCSDTGHFDKYHSMDCILESAPVHNRYTYYISVYHNHYRFHT